MDNIKKISVFVLIVMLAASVVTGCKSKTEGYTAEITSNRLIGKVTAISENNLTLDICVGSRNFNIDKPEMWSASGMEKPSEGMAFPNMPNDSDMTMPNDGNTPPDMPSSSDMAIPPEPNSTSSEAAEFIEQDNKEGNSFGFGDNSTKNSIGLKSAGISIKLTITGSVTVEDENGNAMQLSQITTGDYVTITLDENKQVASIAIYSEENEIGIKIRGGNHENN